MKVKNRSEISQKYKWDLSSIVANDEDFTKIFLQLSAEYKTLSQFKGKLNNAESIFNCLKALDDNSGVVERLYVYAKMRQDEDASVSKYQTMTSKIEQLSVDISAVTSYIVPELNLLESAQLMEYSNNERFKDYSYYISEIVRLKKHILSDKEELILSEVHSFSDGFHDTFSMLDNVDIKFKPIKYEGEDMEMSHGVYSLALQSGDRESRKQAYESMFEAFKGMANTVTQLYSGNVKKNCFFAKMRGYKSAMSKALFDENVEPIVYKNLCDSVGKGLPILHDYVAFRKSVLGYEKLHSWDMHTSIVEGESLGMEYEDACELVKKALLPLGSHYQELLDMSFKDKWIDVYENKGKRSGAYSWGSYYSHPYVLLNYQKTTHDIFTIAHELGHAMHSYYSNKTQPYAKAGYEIFVAEVASTVNEVLLLKHMISTATPEVKKYLLSYYLDMFRTTMFRQTQFAEFELMAHGAYEKGEPLTLELLSKMYCELNAKYYGKHLEQDDLIKYEWSRIPHFYRAFYVYKYATGIISAVKIAKDILSEGAEAVERYMQFLSLGGSMSPVEILKVAGVDLTKEQPFHDVLQEIASTLEELKGCFKS